MNKEFEVHIITPPGIEQMNLIAQTFNELLDSLKKICPESREFSITKTKLEEACFFAKKSIAMNKEYQDIK
jgi:hypothetical protein